MAIGATQQKYILRDGELLVVPPVGLEVQLYLFIVRADQGQLQRLCDRELNIGERRYEPLGDFVVFYAADMVNVVPAGRIGERDFGVWVPVVGGNLEESGFTPERLLSYTPYLWVDSSPALVGGRLVFGFPKHGADLHIPKNTAAAASVKTWVMPFQGGTAEKADLLRITRTDGQWGEKGGAWANANAVTAVLKEFVAEAGHRFLESVLAPETHAAGGLRGVSIPRSGLPMVFLKQTPAADGSWNAAYQAIVEADVDIVAGASGGVLQGNYTVSILECWSHDLVGQLGLSVERVRSGTRTRLVAPARLGARMRFKAVVGKGQAFAPLPAKASGAPSAIETERNQAARQTALRRAKGAPSITIAK
ncbi:MAG: acetoacetate decarboxylase family protein [bacterium]